MTSPTVATAASCAGCSSPISIVDTIITISYRYVFAAGVAYILFYLLARARSSTCSRLGRALSWRLFAPLAEISYGAYLLHPLVIIAFWAKLHPEAMSTLQIVAVGALALILTFLLALILHSALARPFRSWGRRL